MLGIMPGMTCAPVRAREARRAASMMMTTLMFLFMLMFVLPSSFRKRATSRRKIASLCSEFPFVFALARDLLVKP
jgi:hypothetical protein